MFIIPIKEVQIKKKPKRFHVNLPNLNDKEQKNNQQQMSDMRKRKPSLSVGETAN